MKIETVVFRKVVECHKCHEPIIGTAKRFCLSTGARRVYCESCAEKGMANLERFMAKLELPEPEFEAFLQGESD